MVQFMRYMVVCSLNGDRKWREPAYNKKNKQGKVVAGDSFQSILNGVMAKWQAEEKNLKSI